MKGVIPLDPNFASMIGGEKSGIIVTWTARVGPTLAGFICFHLLYHLNYRTVRFAMETGHFLAPQFRAKGRIGFRMWRTAEVALEERGARVIMAHDNAERPLMPFFLALGYDPRSTIFWKILP